MPGRLVDVDSEALVAWPYPVWSRARLSMLHGTFFTQHIVPDSKSKIVPIQEGFSLDLKDSNTQLPGIMRMKQ